MLCVLPKVNENICPSKDPAILFLAWLFFRSKNRWPSN